MWRRGRDVGIGQGCSEGRPHLGLSRGQRDNPVLGQVAYVHSHRDAVIRRRISSPFRILAIPYRHSDRVAGGRLIVQRGLGFQLPGRCVNIESKAASVPPKV